jgi:hypothetical protein
LLSGLRRRTVRKVRRPIRPPHLRRRMCGAVWRRGPETKQPLKPKSNQIKKKLSILVVHQYQRSPIKFEGPRPNCLFGPAHKQAGNSRGARSIYFRETLAPLYNFLIVPPPSTHPQPRRRRHRRSYSRAPRFLSRRRDGTQLLLFLPLSLRQRIVPPVDLVCARMMRSHGSLPGCVVARDPSF